MIKSAEEIIQEQASVALEALGAKDIVSPVELAEAVLRQTVYWDKVLSNGDHLLFIRLFCPIISRQEVFLGNVLLNAFLSKAFARCVSGETGNRIQPIANDLQNFYFLVRTRADLPRLVSMFRAEIEEGLPNLFFGEPNEEVGIYGDLAGMFTFRASNIGPFPVYAVPQFLEKQLEKAVRRELGRLLQAATFTEKSLRTVLAALAFFYGRTSGGSGDAQSFAYFVDHLVNDPSYDGLLTVEDAKRAFNVEEVNKPAIKQSVDSRRYSTEELRVLLSALLTKFATTIDEGSEKWLMGYLRKGNSKFLSISSAGYVDSILVGTQVGYSLLTQDVSSGEVVCRICNSGSVALADSYVVTGLTSFKFHNQSIRNRAEKICMRCSLHSYLAQKLLGTMMLPVGGKLPQVPKTCNLIFHYGRHSDTEVAELIGQIDRLRKLVEDHVAADRVRRAAASAYRSLVKKKEQARDKQRAASLEAELEQHRSELQRALEEVAEVERREYAHCPWMQESGASPVPSQNAALDVVANFQFSETRIEQHILGLGMGGYRMILFVLPQIRPPREAKAQDFAQSRFSNSWITVAAFLSFLRELCGCDGPFYYETVPGLGLETFTRNRFYIRNRSIDVREVQNRYEAVYRLAWELVEQPGPEGFVKKVVLAEELLKDPLGTFAAVMRKSPILGQRKEQRGGYKKLRNVEYRTDWQAEDLTEYSRFIHQLSRL